MPTGFASAHIRIEAQFVGYRALRSVSAKDGCIGGEFCQQVQTLRHLRPAASFEVGASDAHAEQGVAREHHLLFLAVVAASAGGMPGRVDDLQSVRAETHRLALAEVVPHGRFLLAEVETEHLAGLFSQMFYQESVLRPCLHLQPELVVQGYVAPVVVQVSVGRQQVYGLQPFVLDIVADGAPFLLIGGAAVDDDALLGFVAHNVAVFLQHIAHKSLDGQHGR